MSLRPCSDEQQQAIRCLINGNNLIVSATAGSGKTTAVFYIAKAFPAKKIVLLTYNNRLSAETTKRKIDEGIDNLEVYTYHAAMCTFYDPRCQNDRAVRDYVISCNAPSVREIAYDLMIYDEVQDMTPTYFEICCKFRRDNVPPSGEPVRMAVFGDENQCIFRYNNADNRFLTLVDKLTATSNSRPWMKCTFSTSYRITREIANVLNYTMLNENRITAVKSGQRVHYVIGNIWEEDHRKSELYKIVSNYLEVGGPGQIFILVPSLNVIAAKKLENMLKRYPPHGRSTPIYVPSSEDERVREDSVTNGKIVFSTFHQSKGLERDYVLVLSFDKSYFDFYNRSDDPNICPNPLYVAVTRAKTHLTLFHDHTCDYLPFIRGDKLEEYTDMGGSIPIKLKKEKPYLGKPKPVTDLIKRIDMDVEDKALSFVDVHVVTEPLPEDQCVRPPTVTADKLEEISAITGTAIPLWIEAYHTGKLKMLASLKGWDKPHILRINKQFQLDSIDENNLTATELVFIATCNYAKQNGYVSKFYQLKDYDWLTDEDIEMCASRMDELSDKVDFEVRVEAVINSTMICGDIDCIDRGRNCVYEFKCTKDLDTSHVLQLSVYAYLYMCTYPTAPVPKFYLLNLLTNERLEISSSLERLQAMMEHLVECKCADKAAPMTDAEFLASNQAIVDKYWPPSTEVERRILPGRARSPPRYLEDYIVDQIPV